MPLHIDEMEISAKFNDKSVQSSSDGGISRKEMESLREDIIRQCMERIEDYLKKKERR